ncbi:CUB and zona pellucida-like domain-containing protein 1 [Fundulus heteroclitus]|uniref:CUB and zona pellucida-like domain-containing protein 1 n=1 Tax=Fundulus heteroclitus TaxID=8078 RepID=UPI00165CB0D8|nr:CUB and zona pellucida-like domain-containing protein 1 [Fundulus heteroclitus]
MMETGVAALLLVALLGTSSASSFYGDSISFSPLQKNQDGTYKVTFYHRQNGRNDCQNQSSLICEGGVCTDLDQSNALRTDQDFPGVGRWCQTEKRTTATFQANGTTLTLRDSGCCWASNVDGKTNWMSQAQLDLGVRSDTYRINNCPVTTSVSFLRVPQNCFTQHRLLAHDPDGDAVRCRFASGASANFTLDETTCTLRSTGELQPAVHVFELMMEDFSTQNISLSYADGSSASRDASSMNLPPLCRLKLNFVIEVLPAASSCVAGDVLPMFLSRTPSHGEVLHASVGQTFQLHAQAQAQNARIQNFQISGPQNMTQDFSTGSDGKAEVTVSWTPSEKDANRVIPVCFTAETETTQSEMRCAVVTVTRDTFLQGRASVQCLPNKMTVAVEKASMPDVSEEFLSLRDPSCTLTTNGTHIVGTMSFSTCGTKTEDKGDYIVFNNEIHSVERSNEVIIRRKTVKIDFYCQFPKSISISNFYALHQADYIFTESNFGSFGYSFEIFQDGNYTSKVEPVAYPVQVKLMEMIYMGIQAVSELPNVTLFVESCKGTPDNNPDNPMYYELIKNGCVKDETVKIHPSNQTSFNFEIQAFKFNGDYDQVYITCSVILCEPGNPFSRCAQGCVSEPSRRRRRGLSMETAEHYITQGPLQLVGPAGPGAAKAKKINAAPKSDTLPEGDSPVAPETRTNGESWRFREVLASNVTTVVFASGFILSLVLLALVVRHFSRRRRAEDLNVLIEDEFEK